MNSNEGGLGKISGPPLIYIVWIGHRWRMIHKSTFQCLSRAICSILCVITIGYGQGRQWSQNSGSLEFQRVTAPTADRRESSISSQSSYELDRPLWMWPPAGWYQRRLYLWLSNNARLPDSPSSSFEDCQILVRCLIGQLLAPFWSQSLFSVLWRLHGHLSSFRISSIWVDSSANERPGIMNRKTSRMGPTTKPRAWSNHKYSSEGVETLSKVSIPSAVTM